MGGRSHRPVPAKSTRRKPPPSFESKLKTWGDCTGQESLFTVEQPKEKAK